MRTFTCLVLYLFSGSKPSEIIRAGGLEFSQSETHKRILYAALWGEWQWMLKDVPFTSQNWRSDAFILCMFQEPVSKRNLNTQNVCLMLLLLTITSDTFTACHTSCNTWKLYCNCTCCLSLYLKSRDHETLKAPTERQLWSYENYFKIRRFFWKAMCSYTGQCRRR